MKKLFLPFLIFIFSMFTGMCSFAYNDTTSLPECIKKLNSSGAKGIRSYNGGRQYKNIHTLKNGKILYVFQSQASIGCNFNEPASIKYYNDSCKLAGSFPIKFSIKQGFKPFIAKGYTPDDFPEASKGDYPIYFANLEKINAEKTSVSSTARPKDPFPSEKSFKIIKTENQLLDFKTGDVITISTRNGLKHYRSKKLLNTYKIIPQLNITDVEAQCRVPPCFTIETKELVYHLEAAQRFIKIRNNNFLTSQNIYKAAESPNTPMKLSWNTAYGLTAQ